MSAEIEIKIAVDSAADHAALARHLGLAMGAPVRQRNHFFDTAGHDLRRARRALRLREEGGLFTLAAKGPVEASAGDGALTRRLEIEREIEPALAAEILAGRADPRSILEVPEWEVGPLLHLGGFENLRRRLGPVERDGVRLVFELDETRFGERVDFELEVELSEEEATRALPIVQALLAAAGIPWRTAPSKAQRFFELLDQPAPAT